jgi:hypothetical protein
MQNGEVEYNSLHWNWGGKWSDPEWFSVLAMPDWLPPDDVWPELAKLRKEHLRLLDVLAAEAAAFSELQKRFESEDRRYNIALEAHISSGGKLAEDTRLSLDARETELSDARERVEAARKVLKKFLEMATAEIQARAPEWYAELERRRAEVNPKIEQARRLLAEAEAERTQARRMHEWLDRETGRVKTGHYPFSRLTGEYEPSNFVSPDAALAFEFEETEEEGETSEIAQRTVQGIPIRRVDGTTRA